MPLKKAVSGWIEMSGRFLLDTNVIIAIFASDEAVISRLEEAEEVFVPVVAIGELQYGALKSARSTVNTARVSEFALESTVLSIDRRTATEYGRIKAVLRERGRPIPENDIWIAALALQHDLTLVSRDQHFGHVDSVITETW